MISVNLGALEVVIKLAKVTPGNLCNTETAANAENEQRRQRQTSINGE